MNLCERKTAVGESLAKGLEKGSDVLNEWILLQKGWRKRLSVQSMSSKDS